MCFCFKHLLWGETCTWKKQQHDDETLLKRKAASSEGRFEATKKNTPWKFNIAPENGWLEDEFPLGIPYFQGLCETFGRVNISFEGSDLNRSKTTWLGWRLELKGSNKNQQIHPWLQSFFFVFFLNLPFFVGTRHVFLSFFLKVGWLVVLICYIRFVLLFPSHFCRVCNYKKVDTIPLG